MKYYKLKKGNCEKNCELKLSKVRKITDVVNKKVKGILLLYFIVVNSSMSL